MLRRHFLYAQYSSLDLIRLRRQSDEAQREREALEEADRQATRWREQKEALRNLTEAIETAKPFITNPHITNAKALKQYRDALRRALNSLKD